MPRKSKGPRLQYRRDKGYWYIRDDKRSLGTGCTENEVGGAEKALAAYIDSKHEITSSSRPSEVGLTDVLILYTDDIGPTWSRPEDLGYIIDALEPFWGARTVADIRGETCRAYVKRRSTISNARKELETLRAAVNHYHAEKGLDVVPKFTLPEKAQPRERWATRDEVARLLWACRKLGHKHVARVILVAVYSGTRSGPIFQTQWIPNTTGGYVDLDKGIYYRQPPRTRQTNKRKPPVRIARKLLGHMRRWKKADGNIRHMIHYQGKPIKKLRRSWKAVRELARIDDDLVIHSLRHSAATWLMQKGVDRWEAAGYLGMSVETLERTYGHHHPDYQKEAAEAL